MPEQIRSYADREPQAYFARLAELQHELRTLYARKADANAITMKKIEIRGFRLSANSVYGQGI